MQNNTNTTFAKMTSTFLPPALATVVKKTNNWQFYSSNNLHFFKGCHKIYNFVLIYRQILEASKRRKRKEKQFQLQIFGLWCWLVGWLEEKCILSILSGYWLFEHFKYRLWSWKLCSNLNSLNISVYFFQFWVWLVAEQRQVFVLAISSHPSYLDTGWSM